MFRRAFLLSSLVSSIAMLFGRPAPDEGLPVDGRAPDEGPDRKQYFSVLGVVDAGSGRIVPSRRAHEREARSFGH